MGVLVDEGQDMSQQGALAAQKVNCALGYIQSNVAGRGREAVLPLCSDFVRPNPTCVQLWGPQYKKDVDLLE